MAQSFSQTGGAGDVTRDDAPRRVKVIRPPSFSPAALLRGLSALADYADLLRTLSLHRIKVRYKQSALGAAWAVLQPLLTTLVFTLFFGLLAGVKSETVPYPLFAYAGLVPWTFFANAVAQSSNSLVGSAHLISKVYFPRLLVPAASVGAGLADFAVSSALLAGMMAYYGVAPGWGLLLLPVPVALSVLLALGAGMWLSALNVRYRDVRYAVPFMIQVLMFVSPVIYPPSFVPERWRWLLRLNPLTGIIDGFRASLFGGRGPDWAALAVSAAVTLGLLVYATFAFRRMERSFADIV